MASSVFAAGPWRPCNRMSPKRKLEWHPKGKGAMPREKTSAHVGTVDSADAKLLNVAAVTA